MGVAPVLSEHRVMVIIKHVTSNRDLVVADPEQHVAQILGCVFIQGIAILQGDLRATVILVELQVHHAGNRVRSVGGRSAIFQNLNALDSCDRNGSQIYETGAAAGGPRLWRNATAIDQDKRSTGIETAQRNRSRSRWTALAGRVSLDRDTARTKHRLALKKRFHRAALTRFVNQVAVETINRV